MIQLRNLSVGYGRKVLLSGATAEVAGGRMVTLLGANGAGKSTLLKIIAGELQPLGGEAMIDGKCSWSMPRREMARALSVVNTDRVDVDALTVSDLVGMGRYPYTGFFGRLDGDDRRIVAEALVAVGMDGCATRMVTSLSDGERQKVMIARALAQATPAILLDEPTAFLDVASRVEVNALLGRLAHELGKAILMTSHDVASAMEMSDGVWLLPGDGTLVASTPSELVEVHEKGADDSPLDRLFAGRGVEFDSRRLDYRPKK